MAAYSLSIKPSAVEEIEAISTKRDRQRVVRRVAALVAEPRPRRCEMLTGPTLAAAYGFAVARNHPFVEGNERAAVLLVAVFAALNGLRFDPDQVDEVATFLALAEGAIDEPAYAAWVAAQCS